ncbi:hypothetical protein V8G54_025824 [Vigna mungo]|uniref:Uncharacterized protein n=1 Tax=Vigna mungo TaxID=3915 RepID=A0AAQ3MZF7_VIGMU
MARWLSHSPLWLPIPNSNLNLNSNPNSRVLRYQHAYRAQLRVRCSEVGEEKENEEKKKKRLSEQSSWEAKDAQGRDYLYRLGKEADNMNIAVGQRAGVIDSLFVGDFLGKDCQSNVIIIIILFLRTATKWVSTLKMDPSEETLLITHFGVVGEL